MSYEEELKKNDLGYVWHPFTQMRIQQKWGSKIIVEGKGCKITDIQGNEYIDGMGGLFTAAVGHGRQEIIQALVEQGEKIAFMSLFDFMTNEPAINLAMKLAQITPGDLRYVQFGCSGSDAVEIALKIARQYQARKGFSGRYKIIARRYSFHGVSFGALSANGVPAFREAFEPLVPGFRHIQEANCYQCPFGKKYPQCDIDCAQALEQQVLFEDPETVAAFIVDPIPVATGIFDPPTEYLSQVREICNKYGMLLIFDEISTGFGKTGKLFASDLYEVEPDIMTMGKALSGGYFPISAVIVKPEIYEAFLGPTNKEAFLHGQTFQGHPLGCAVALKNIEIIERENLIEKAEQTGKYLGEKLKELLKYGIVADICGRGLFRGVRLVDENRGDNLCCDIGLEIQQRSLELGFYCGFRGSSLIMVLPLIISKEEVDKIVAILDQTIMEAEDKYFKR